jgi:hypothetical protein
VWQDAGSDHEMDGSRGIDHTSGPDQIGDASGRQGIEMQVVQRPGRWLALGQMHGREWVMAEANDPGSAARVAWQRHLAANGGSGES